MPIYLLDESLMINILYEPKDCDFHNNICLSIIEDCPEEEKIFGAEQSNLYITPLQARALASALSNAAHLSEKTCDD
jgi:hypothetical protein